MQFYKLSNIVLAWITSINIIFSNANFAAPNRILRMFWDFVSYTMILQHRFIVLLRDRNVLWSRNIKMLDWYKANYLATEPASVKCILWTNHIILGVHLWHKMKHASNLDPALTGNQTRVHWLDAQHTTTELGPLVCKQSGMKWKGNSFTSTFTSMSVLWRPPTTSITHWQEKGFCNRVYQN